MNKRLSLSLLLSGLLASFSSYANNDWYLGAQYSLQQLDLQKEDHFNAFGLVGGYQINEYFSVEGRFNFNTTDNTFSTDWQNLTNINLKRELDNQYSLLGKVNFLNYSDFSLYGVVGYAVLNFDFVVPGKGTDGFADGTSLAIDHKETGLTYGLGAEYRLNKEIRFYVDYQRLPEFEVIQGQKDDGNSINLGMTYHF